MTTIVPRWTTNAQSAFVVRSVLMLFVLATVAAVYVAWVTRSTEQAIASALAAHHARSTAEFETWLDERIQQAHRWVDRPNARAMIAALVASKDASAQELNDLPLQAAFRNEFAVAQGREGALGYFVISPDGRTLGSLTKEHTGMRHPLTAEPEFFEQMRKRGGAVSPFMVSDIPLQNSGTRLDGKSLTIFIGVPIYLGDETPAAYFALCIPPMSLLAEQGKARLRAGGVSFLVDGFGRLHADRTWMNLELDRYGIVSEPFRGRPHLFVRDPGRNLFAEAFNAASDSTSIQPTAAERSRLPLTHSVSSAQKAAGSTLTPYRDHRGVSVVGAWGPSTKLGLNVITEIPASEAFSPVTRARQQVLVCAIVLTSLLLGVLTWRLHRSRQLLQTALLHAEAASRAKGVFLANMSHEIRTPLNAVLGVAHLLGNTSMTPTQQEYVQMISSSGKTLLGTLNDILDYSKVEAGKLELVNDAFSLNEMVDTLSVIMGVNAAPKDLDLIIGIEPEVPTFFVGDSQRLLQVLVNLTGNAIKFTSSGRVMLHICADGAVPAGGEGPMRVRFAVKDTGIGIAPDKQRTLFKPFTQADPGTSRDFGGTGLGLAICQRLIELMGGEIGVVSTPGEGSEFWFIVPLQATMRPATSSTKPPYAVRDVLVVDDNDIAREFLVKIVERLGWQSHPVDSGPKAIESLTSNHERGQAGYDVLLIDATMPLMDGLQTSKAIRAIEGLQQPPIVVMVTALGREQVLASPDAEAIDAVVAKPVTPSKIFDAVMEAHSKRRHGYVRMPRPYTPARKVNDLQGMRMLLVEDNYINQQVARGILEAEGAIVTLADQGIQALEILKRSAELFDIVLMDVQMPLMDGIEATRRIRGELKLDIPIVAMSAGVMQNERDTCIEAGMNAFIPKPLDPRTVVTTLRKLGVSTRQRDARFEEAPAPSPDSLPAIDGIDVPELFDALNRNRPSMMRLLSRLLDECDSVVIKLDDGISKQDAPLLKQALHNFKGVAANMRAKALSLHAAELESALRLLGPDGLSPLRASFVREVIELRAAVEATLQISTPR